MWIKENWLVTAKCEIALWTSNEHENKVKWEFQFYAKSNLSWSEIWRFAVNKANDMISPKENISSSAKSVKILEIHFAVVD